MHGATLCLMAQYKIACSIFSYAAKPSPAFMAQCSAICSNCAHHGTQPNIPNDSVFRRCTSRSRRSNCWPGRLVPNRLVRRRLVSWMCPNETRRDLRGCRQKKKPPTRSIRGIQMVNDSKTIHKTIVLQNRLSEKKNVHRAAVKLA